MTYKEFPDEPGWTLTSESLPKLDNGEDVNLEIWWAGGPDNGYFSTKLFDGGSFYINSMVPHGMGFYDEGTWYKKLVNPTAWRYKRQYKEIKMLDAENYILGFDVKLQGIILKGFLYKMGLYELYQELDEDFRRNLENSISDVIRGELKEFLVAYTEALRLMNT